MTTIAVKDGIVAADTQATSSYKQQGYSKIFRLSKGPEKGSIVAFTGYLTVGQMMVSQLEAGEMEKIEVAEGQETTAVLLTPRGTFMFDSHYMEPTPVVQPSALGSGADFAMGAMLQGASAEDAVKIAHQLDPGTGPEVVTMKLEPPKRTRRLKAVK